jgi:hypothetical protein
LVDRPPPSRFSVVERGGRLVVIDKTTGQTPLSAAERMDQHDRAMGVEPIRPARTSAAPDMSAAARAESGLSARPAPARQAGAANGGNASMAAAVAERNKRPWNNASANRDRPAPAAAPARIADRPPPRAGGARKTIVTGKWWDSKGPRTIELGPKGQSALSGGFVAIVIGALIAAVVLLMIEPVIFFITGFLLFRFGGGVLGPIGAGIVDKALAERD